MSFDHYVHRVMSGAECGPKAAALRAAMTAAEPFYTAAVRVRNRLYDGGFAKARTLPRPVISVGNVTTGGTGKTPVVRWLASKLR
jgi:tetraacyldisaccharide 4'-kinase